MISYIIRKIIILLDSFIHQKRIISSISKLNFKIDNIIDIGSHNGAYTILFKKKFPSSKIFCFEPQISQIKLAKSKLKKFKNIFFFNIALGDKKQQLLMKVNLGSSYVSTFSEFNFSSRYLNLRNFIIKPKKNHNDKIQMINLDSLKILKKKKIDLLKIDVEGYELKVLQGAKNVLRNSKCVIIEFHNSDIYKNFFPKKIHNLLKDSNFKLVKKIKFPFLSWEDRIYVKKNIKDLLF